MKYTEIQIETNPLWAEYLTELMINDFKCDGVVTQETFFDDEKVVKNEINVVKGYFYNENVDLSKFEDSLKTHKNNLLKQGIKEESIGSWDVLIKEAEDEDWAHNWKKYWQTQKIGNKIVICPSWLEYEPKQDEIKIELDPGSAFGTGTHPTTRLCIKALEKYVQQGFAIADIGTGSGILAIAALKFGAATAMGVDNDASVIGVAIENAEKNNVLSQCKFYQGSSSDVKDEYDIVVANILANIIIGMMNELVILVKQGGKLILSGINIEKAEEVRQKAISCGLNILETTEEDGWVAIIAVK